MFLATGGVVDVLRQADIFTFVVEYDLNSRYVRNRLPSVIRRTVGVPSDTVEWHSGFGVLMLLKSVVFMRYDVVHDDLFRVILVASFSLIVDSDSFWFFWWVFLVIYGLSRVRSFRRLTLDGCSLFR